MEQELRAQKRAGRREKEKTILFRLVELYLKTGRPVSSHALQEEVGIEVSSATIRNYFVALEAEGYVKQQHLSGGRTPQAKAFVEYARYSLDRLNHNPSIAKSSLALPEVVASNEVVTMLQQAGELLSLQAGMAVAVSSPRFDHDSITELKFVYLDVQKALAVITTEFGLVHTTLLYSPSSLSHVLLRKADRFARSRLFREVLEPDFFEGEELEQVRKLYQEAMASYLVSYSSVSSEDVWRTGFSRLLRRSEFEETQDVSASLSLFENVHALRNFSREVARADRLRFWIGEELSPFLVGEPNCAVIAVPYRVGSRAVGALVAIGSMKIPYYDLFCTMQTASEQISSLLSECLMHHRMTYRMPETQAIMVQGVRQLALDMYRAPDQERSL